MQLTYRGQAYNYTPATLLPVATTGVTRTLFYRGCAYQCSCPALQPSRLPGAINWRFAGRTVFQTKRLSPAH